MAHDILVVDDEADIREMIAGILDDEGFGTRTASNSDTAIAAIKERRPSLVILDIWLQGSRLDGLAVLDVIKETDPDLPVVIISGHGNIETAVSAIKRGAYDYIEKPFKTDRLIHIVERALEASSLKREIRDLKQRSGDVSELIGESSAANNLRSTIQKIAGTNSRILITGPSGAGKELAARQIHTLSPRAKSPFVVINAATITPDRMEEELFGVEDESGNLKKVGAFEEAHGGTLYLDEVADMPAETQSKILRVLVDQSFTRVGGASKVQVDIRILSSTAKNLEEHISAGLFRQDLYHRLGVVPLYVPGLAERREDIPTLVGFFMEQISSASGIPLRPIGDDAMAVLQTHDWPGNVRQLRNNVERLLILSRGEPDSVITADLLPAEIGSMLPNLPTTGGGEHLMSVPLREAREIFERDYLQAQIKRFDGNISRTAEFVGMERSALHRKLKSLGLS
ncbi:two component, sigma54 specific, transcriptional regulator, Fis family [Roseibium hamelinense]|uniref:Two component, sigma54 specific, transcriptional regulator, Fis family n=1 Tax=Roseibium hamelinense TaxID=150831 RepID=A0A562THA5_9HYPH|nr:sigma-54 dependent transcriptional regulator [Roseibium hamelinense]MTI45865.1 sigma-54-dependent Fis family transcriptional regulator [Roseibium hamelinense]TWI92952.1 two component, sigma54 specific, transcriptional regulator, Fis family [Roseibium hamelinense]